MLPGLNRFKIGDKVEFDMVGVDPDGPGCILIPFPGEIVSFSSLLFEREVGPDSEFQSAIIRCFGEYDGETMEVPLSSIRPVYEA